MSEGIVTLWEAFEDLDKEEGRGGRQLLGYFEDPDDARHAARGKGPQGTAGAVQPVRAVRIGDFYYRIHEAIAVGRVRTRAQAEAVKTGLAKLTKEEKEALGL